MNDLAASSIQLILESQAASGAYPAAPTYPTYQYCWFRDSSYIAHAMDLTGHPDSARRFHDWAAAAVNRRADLIQRAVARQHDGQPLDIADVLHTRYTLDGDETPVDWPNFQLDGLGTWLWSLAHHTPTGSLPTPWQDAADLAADYLAALWNHPCYDLWEEFPDQIHTHTLAAIHGGLTAHQQTTGADHERILKEIAARIHLDGVRDGHFTKHLSSTDIDASLIGLATPYRVVDPDHPTLTATVERMRGALWQPGRGVHRYPNDSFYGGGGWVVLAGWLGWYYAELGDDQLASGLLSWVEQQADPDGHLPEQISEHLIHPGALETWTAQWGPVARPLLWSHANYLILSQNLLRQPPEAQRQAETVDATGATATQE